jgi:hypothetical protein
MILRLHATYTTTSHQCRRSVRPPSKYFPRHRLYFKIKWNLRTSQRRQLLLLRLYRSFQPAWCAGHNAARAVLEVVEVLNFHESRKTEITRLRRTIFTLRENVRLKIANDARGATVFHDAKPRTEKIVWN